MAEYADVLLGSLAYRDAARAGAAAPRTEVPRHEREYEAPRERTAPKPSEAVRANSAAKARSKQALPLFAVAGTLLVALVMVRLLVSYVSLTKLSNEAAELERSIAELKEERAKLEIEYESAFNLKEIERYAMAELGMVKAGNEQKVYLNGSLDDKAVMLGGKKPGIAGKIKAFFGSVLAYLR